MNRLKASFNYDIKGVFMNNAIICQQCGTKNEENIIYCDKCGVFLENDDISVKFLLEMTK